MKNLMSVLVAILFLSSSVSMAAPECANGSNGDFQSVTAVCWMPSPVYPGAKSVVYSVTRNPSGPNAATACTESTFSLTPSSFNYDHNFPGTYATAGFLPQPYCVRNVEQNMFAALGLYSNLFQFSSPTIPRCDATGTSSQHYSWFLSQCMTGVLPVSLVSFDVKGSADTQNAAEVTWVTASELNSAEFIIEQSRDGSTYTEAARVSAAGNSSQLVHYRKTIQNLKSGLTYFRLKQIDQDGTAHVFEIRSLKIAPSESYSGKLYPNPVTSASVLVLSGLQAERIEVQVLDVLGAQLWSKQFFGFGLSPDITISLNELDIPAAGIYFYRVIADGVVVDQQRFVVSGSR